ncbi:hypothetical protein DO64_6166 [Burkholderia pseudomallei]|nr:hypothetical protein DO64_6166 [Burkholderia pseudomallei]
MRKTRDRGGRRKAVAAAVAVDQVDQPSGALGRRDERVEPVLAQHAREPLVARAAAATGERVAVRGGVEPARLLRVQQQLLPEIRHLPRMLPRVERDHVGERAHARVRRERPQPRRQAVLELVQQHDLLVFLVIGFRQIDRVDHDRAEPLHLGDRALDLHVHLVVPGEVRARDAEPRAAQRIRIERGDVVRRRGRARPRARRAAAPRRGPCARSAPPCPACATPARSRLGSRARASASGRRSR